MQLYIHLRSIFPPCTWVYDSSFWPEIQRGVMETLPFYLNGQFILPLHASTVLDTCFCVRSAPIVNFWGELVLVSFFFFTFFYCCSSTVFCLSPQSSWPPQPSSPPSPIHPPCFFPGVLVFIYTPLVFFLCVLYNCSYKPFPLFPCNLPHSPLWSLSACFHFQCVCLYFAFLFILLIRFLLKVRSYGVCLSPPGLFHLA